MHFVRIALYGPGQPPPRLGRNRSRDYAAPHHDLGTPRAAHLRAQLEPEMLIAARMVLVRQEEVAQCRLPGSQNVHLNKAHERGEKARGKSGKNGGEDGGKGGGWVGGGLESSLAPWMAGRHAVTRPPSP